MPLSFQTWQRQSMLKNIVSLPVDARRSKRPCLSSLIASVHTWLIVSGLIFLYSVNSRICGQFEPFRDFFLEPCSSHRPNVSFWNWNSVTQGIYGQVHPDEIVVAHFLATTEIPSSLALCYYSVPQLHEHLNKNFLFEYLLLGCVFLGKSKCEFPNPKTYFAFFGQIQKRIMNP